MKLPSVMKHSFSQIPRAEIERSVFDRTHTHKTMFDSGYLIPFYVDEALPGDTFNVNATLFTRMPSALNVPVMDNMFLDTFYFAVPVRLVWPNFVKMCGEQATPGDSTSYTVPQIVSPASTGWAVGTLSDYFGLPTGIVGLSVSSLWHRAYNLIWNTWFRDENLQNPAVVDLDDGPDTNSDYVLLKRGKRRDYFTSCLPWAQKGTAPTIGIGSSAPVKLTNDTGTGAQLGAWLPRKVSDSSLVLSMAAGLRTNSSGQLTSADGSTILVLDPNTTLIADLTSAGAVTINALRLAVQTQKMYERDARGGTRYTEIVLSHFGVSSPDARLQRPEFLGGRSTPISVTSVPQTSNASGQATPQGNLAAFALGMNNTDGFTKSFTEHTLILGMCMVRADLTYQQGIPRMFKRSTRFDFYWPALSHLGEQSVLNQEIYSDASSHDTEVFGYQERWAEYRYYNSKITGKLRSTYSTPLDMWHLSQKFTALPTLSSTFIQEDVPIARITAVTSEPQFVLDSYIQCKAVRPMPTYSVPGLVDHF